MKTMRLSLRILLVLSAVLASAPLSDAQSLWSAVVNTATDTNWSTAANWTPVGVPGASSNVVFNDTTGVPDTLTTNSVVDAAFGGTISSLALTNFATAQNLLIASGVTLNITGSGGLAAGNANVLTTATSPVTTISGAGASLVISNAAATLNVQIAEPSTSGTRTLNMTNLDTFSFTGARMLVGVAGGARTSGTLYLARTNTIILTPGSTAPQIDIGDNPGNNGPGSVLYLGMTNVIFADSIAMGRIKQNSGGGGRILFNPAFTNNNPVAYFRGTNGVGPVSTWAIADGGTSSGTITDTGTSDFSGGTVNAVVTSLWLARNGSGASAGTSVNNGTLTFSAGSFTVGNLTNAMLASSAQSPTVNGTVNVNGTGVLTVTNVFIMAALNGFTGTANSTLNVNGGVAQVNTLVAGGGNSTVSVNGGTLIITNTAGTPASPLTTLNLTTATLQLPVGNTANVVVNSFNPVDTANTVNVTALPLVTSYDPPSQFPIISYTSLIGGGSLNLGALPGTFQGYVSNDYVGTIWLVITNGPTLAKTDQWGGGVNNNWDTTTLNWTNAGVAVAYKEGDFALFDDSARTGTVNLPATRAPNGLTFSNNTLNYTLTGPGNITGPVRLVKQGAASVMLSETGGDNFSGGIAVNGGTVILDNPNSAISGGATVAPSATLQIGNNDANGNLPAGAVDVDGTLTFSRTDNVAVNTSISGAGSLTQNGSGVLTLNRTNSYTGVTAVLKGALALTTAGAISNSASVFVGGATLDVSAMVGPTLLYSLSLSNASLSVALTDANLQTPVSVVNGALAMAGSGNTINVAALPTIATYPVTLALAQAVGGISGFNMTLGSLPAANPPYAGSISQSADHTTVLLTLTAGPTGVRPSVLWVGTNYVSVTTNWSDRLNWQLPGVPGAADNVVFNSSAAAYGSAVAYPGGGISALVPYNFNNVVDTSFTISTLTYTNLGGTYHNTEILPGASLNVTNTLTVGAISTGANTSDQGYVSLAGTGASLNVNNTNANVQIWYGNASSGNHQATLDLSALDNFGANVSRLAIGASVGNTVDRPSGILYLARTNNITAGFLTTTTDAGTTTANGGIVVADCNSNPGSQSQLWLGEVNNFIADTIGIGRQKASGVVQFNSIYANVAPYPSVTFQGLNGNPVTLFEIGNSAGNTGTTGGTSDVNLTGGFVTANIATLTVGRGSAATSGSGVTTGSLEFDAGSITANTVNIGLQPTNNASKYGIGTITVGTNSTLGTGATLSVSGNLNLAPAINAANAAGTLNIDGGTVLANTIVAGAIGNSTITLGISGQGGRLVVTNTIGSPAAPLTTLNLYGGTLQLIPRVGATNIVATSVVGAVPTTIIIPSIANATPGTMQIPLISYVSGDPYGVLTLGSVPAGYTGASLVDNTANQTVDLLITSPPTLTWVGAVGSTLNGNWDQSTANWRSGVSPTVYADPDFALFDDSASNGVVTLTATLSPSGVTVNNNSLNYTFAGNGKISGGTSLTKQGSGSLTIANAMANDFSGAIVLAAGGLIYDQTVNATVANVISGSGSLTKLNTNMLTLAGVNSAYTGDVTIKQGTLRINNTNALGSWTAGVVTITNGGTLDIGGWTGSSGNANNMFGAKPFYIAGAGVGGNGAIVNNGGPAQNAAFEWVTLTADATVGGTSRWDLRNAPTLDLAGHTLTKTGSNQVSLVAATVTDGNLVIAQGTLSVETASAINGTGAITVNSGAALGHYRTSGGAITRPITLNGGALTNLSVSGGNSTNDANITLTADSTVLLNSGSDLILNGVISQSGGAFGLTKLGPGRTVLTANETYAGNTVIGAGTLALSGNGAIPNSAVISLATNATLDVSGRADQTLALNAGQTLSGFGTVTGSVTAAIGSTVAPGSAANPGTLTVSSNVTLNGTTLIKLNHDLATNDLLAAGGTVTYGGTLYLTNLSGVLAAGDTFKLFDAPPGNYSGTFASLVPATPGAGLAWDTSGLAVDGTLKVVVGGTPPAPRITALTLSGTTLGITATNGLPGGGWTLLQSADLTLPLSQWETNRTGAFDGSGNLFTNIVNAATNLQEFYILKQ